MAFSTTYANGILNYLFGKTSQLTAPTNVYVGLCTNAPETDGGTFTELTNDWYERTLIVQRGTGSASSTFYTNLMTTATNREIHNEKQINWFKALDEVTVKGFGLFSSETGGTPFYYGDFEAPIKCNAGAVFLFSPEMLKVNIGTVDEELTESK